MTAWYLIAEFQALILLCIIGVFLFEKRTVVTRRSRIFGTVLLLSVGTVLLNILCVYFLETPGRVPVPVSVGLNSLYFLASFWTGTGVAFYLLDLVLEHIYPPAFRRRAQAALLAVNVLFLAVVLANLQTGILFRIDARGGYHRGMWNQLGYLLILLEMGIVLAGCLRYRMGTGDQVLRLIGILFPLILALLICQVLYPQLLLNGTICSLVLLVLYIRFQNYQSEKDALTGLGSRKTLYEEIALHMRGGQKFQVILINLHGFEQINQAYGRRRGDGFLHLMGSWLDTRDPLCNAYRFGNVSFALLYPLLEEETASGHIRSLQERFEQPWELGMLRCGIQAGFCELRWEGQPWNADQFIEYLETLKLMGKDHPGTVVRFTEETERLIRSRRSLKQLLQEAIREKKFELYFQPVYDCRKNCFSSAEVLLRLWDHDGRMVPPSEFIPYAEELGMSQEIGWIVLEKACRFLERHRRLGLDSLSVNFSMGQFQDPQVARRILGELEEHRLPAERLKIEITERELAGDQKKLRAVMNMLDRAGVRFYLDDFGTGYSNFSMVMHLPFSCIKLDRSLLLKITDSEKDCRMIRDMSRLFHDGGLQVISEGVEAAEQAELLRELGTDYIQGFCYARPMPEPEFIRFLTAQPV